MDIQRPLFWHQGLFLQPQHFQLLDLSIRTHLSSIHSSLQPHFWGTAEIDIQQSALGTGSFKLQSGSFLFPDGAFVSLPVNAVAESRSFTEAWGEGGKPMRVYAGLKKWNPAGGNVTVLEKSGPLTGITTRFISKADPEDIKDLHSDGPGGQVKTLHYMVRIFWENETDQLGDYDLVPIAQLERSGEDITLAQNYIQPCLSISGAGILARVVRDIRDQLTSRSYQLEEYKRQRGIQNAEFGSRDMVYLLALRSLNRYVPLLLHYTETRQVHPWTVYGTLRQLIGELSSFSEKVNVMGEFNEENIALPAYDHRGLWECFSTAQTLISRLIDEITAGPEYVIRLVYDGTYYAAELKPAIFESRNRFYLVCRTEADPKSVIQSLTSIAKLSAREHLPILIARALPGIRLEHLPLPPQELPRRANTVYIAIDHHSDQWSFVTKGNNLALYWDNAPEDLEVELMVVGRQ
ncbi:MAG: type VI secretion system baseplate subunit TssK [Nitrospiraceae bacterium]|nr:MAG: type VI secretion system baseplate subunit TssK [Nitrospiraceae bacterium]